MSILILPPKKCGSMLQFEVALSNSLQVDNHFNMLLFVSDMALEVCSESFVLFSAWSLVEDLANYANCDDSMPRVPYSEQKIIMSVCRMARLKLK